MAARAASAGGAVGFGAAEGAPFGAEAAAAGFGGLALVAWGFGGEASAGSAGAALAPRFAGDLGAAFEAGFEVGLGAGFVAGFAEIFGAVACVAACVAVGCCAGAFGAALAAGLATGFVLAEGWGVAFAVVRAAVLRGGVATLPPSLAAVAGTGRRASVDGFGFVASLAAGLLAAFGFVFAVERAVVAAGFVADFETGFLAVSFVVRLLFDWAVAFITLPARSSYRVSATPASPSHGSALRLESGRPLTRHAAFHGRKANPGAAPSLERPEWQPVS